MFTLLKQLFSVPECLGRVTMRHIRTFIFDMDPIQECENVDQMWDALSQEQQQYERQKQNFTNRILQHVHFVPPFLLMFAVQLDNLIFFARENFRYNSTGMEEFFVHKIFPSEMWFQADVCINMGTSSEIVIFGLLMLMIPIEPRYRIFAVRSIGKDGKLDRIVSNGKCKSVQLTN